FGSQEPMCRIDKFKLLEALGVLNGPRELTSEGLMRVNGRAREEARLHPEGRTECNLFDSEIDRDRSEAIKDSGGHSTTLQASVQALPVCVFLDRTQRLSLRLSRFRIARYI